MSEISEPNSSDGGDSFDCCTSPPKSLNWEIGDGNGNVTAKGIIKVCPECCGGCGSFIAPNGDSYLSIPEGKGDDWPWKMCETCNGTGYKFIKDVTQAAKQTNP